MNDSLFSDADLDPELMEIERKKKERERIAKEEQRLEEKKKEEEKTASVPVGYEKIVDMYPLDFEEFLWANGISDNIIDEIRKHFNEETPVPDGLHVPLNDLFRKYAVVGGMPEAVNTFLETNNISDVYEVQQNIIEEYKDDMVKYPQLAKENKKAQYSVVKRCLPS